MGRRNREKAVRQAKAAEFLELKESEAIRKSVVRLEGLERRN
jgi:hypothetical protein